MPKRGCAAPFAMEHLKCAARRLPLLAFGVAAALPLAGCASNQLPLEINAVSPTIVRRRCAPQKRWTYASTT